jgi:hypothetical protein
LIKRLQFDLERFLLRGVHYRLLIAVFIVVAVAIIAGGLVLLLDPRFEELGSAVWWAFLRLTDPGYLGDDEGTTSRSISTVVTVLGYILFLGLLIAILTQWMNAWIERVERGFSQLTFEGHILILGWNHRTPSIVLELLRTKARTSRFLEARDATRLRIVVLAEEVDVALRATLRAALGNLWDDRQVILRSGNPLHIDSLERVAFRTAAAIILPGADFATARPGVSDAETIKSLASISHHAGTGNGKSLPLAVAALYNSNRRRIAEAAYQGPLAVVDADRMVARILAQSVLQPCVWDVYAETLAINEGNAFFLRTVPPGVEADFAGLQAGAGEALLVGTLERQTRVVRLNPPDDLVVSEGDKLVFIARNQQDCLIQENTGSLPDASERVKPDTAVTEASRVLVLGWSRKVPLFIRELLSYDQAIESIDVVGITPVADREGDGALADDRVRQVTANFLDPDVLRALEPMGYDTVVLIARERLGGEAVADAATISAYLELEEMGAGPRPHVVVEVLEEENLPLFNGGRDDVMLSPMVVSYVLSQIALEPELGRIFRELSRPTGTGIALLSIWSERGDTLPRFSEARAAARRQGYLAIGILAESINGGRLLLNPDDELSWTPGAADRLVVLTPADR